MESDKMESEMATRRLEFSDFGVPFGINRYSSLPRMAEEMAQQDMKRSATRRLEFSDFGVPFGINRYSSLPRMAHRSVEAFGSGLTLMNDSFIRPRQRSLPRRATGSLNSSDSDVSLKSDQSKEDVTNFKDRVSPRLEDFSSSEKKHVVADDEGLVESPDDLEEMNQELSSEVGWKHLEAPVSSCS